jgi:hypothetical protein
MEIARHLVAGLLATMLVVGPIEFGIAWLIRGGDEASRE